MSDALDRITTLAHLLVAAINNVDRKEAELSAAKEERRRLEEDDLPELMRELDLMEIKLSDGSSVKVVDEVQCAITEARRPAAHKWLAEHGFGGLIKTEVVVVFGRDEHDAAVSCAEELHEAGRAANVEERVHPSTLKSFVKEQLALGADVPADLFALRPYAKAKITQPRTK